MSWYSGPSVQRPIDKLVDSGITKVEQLFNDPDFFSELKAFNPKLLEFLTNNPFVVEQALVFISTPPQPDDSDDRKYKYPMMAVEMIEPETVSILNSFFKPSLQGGFVIEQLFRLLEQKEIMPILGGYFVRIICVLLKQKYKEILDFVYSKPDLLKSMIDHTSNISITQSLQMFLCLQSSKSQRVVEGKEETKVQILSATIKQLITSKSPQVITNICYLLINLIDNYYLISDSKKMLEVVLSEELSQYLLSSILQDSREQTISHLLLSILRYYTYSSFNIEQKQSPQQDAQIIERLQKQPFIITLCKYYKHIIDKVVQTPSAFQKHCLIQIISQTLQLNSDRLFQLVRQTQLFTKLIGILSTNESANIVHHQISKLIEVIFSNERAIYERYQEYLFCEVHIITLTLSQIQNQTLKTAATKDYFGHLIKIIKNYSKIQTSNKQIYEVIEKNKDLWTRVANGIIKSYTEASQKELGTYEVPEPKPVEYKETRTIVPTTHPTVMVNLNIDDEYKSFKSMTTSYPQHTGRISFDPNLFQLPLQIPSVEQNTQHKSAASIINQEVVQSGAQVSKSIEGGSNKKIPLIIEVPESEPIPMQPTKSPSWEEYKKNASMLAQKKIELQKRSISQEKQRRLTPNARGKSPGVAKVKRSWGDSNDQKPAEDNKSKEEDKNAIISSKIPAAPKNPISQSMILTKEPVKKNETLHQSMANLNDLRFIKVKFVPGNKTEEPKKSRKVEPKDMALLNFLGIKVSSK